MTSRSPLGVGDIGCHLPVGVYDDRFQDIILDFAPFFFTDSDGDV